LEHALTFAEYQFGKQDALNDLCIRDNGERFGSWEVEVEFFSHIYEELGVQVMICVEGDVKEDCLIKSLTYWEKSATILESWIVKINMNDERIYNLFYKLSIMERNIAIIYKNLKHWDKVQHFREQSVYHAKQMKEGELKIKVLFSAWSSLGDLYYRQRKLTEVKAIREEAYEYVNETYDIDHPLTLEAGRHLVEILGEIGDYYDSERFARVCYESLTRAPRDPEGLQAAFAASNLAIASCNMIKSKGSDSTDIREAEMLARKAVRIMKKLGDLGGDGVRWTFGNLVIVLFQ
jgi:tetratricopeptide (TPR) repeat protein